MRPFLGAPLDFSSVIFALTVPCPYIYFEPGDSFTDEEYKAMYDCVESLFSLKIIDGIFGCDSYIRFAIPNRWDDDASLYYTKEGTNFPNVVGQIEEHEYIAPNWHAVVVSTFD